MDFLKIRFGDARSWQQKENDRNALRVIKLRETIDRLTKPLPAGTVGLDVFNDLVSPIR